jgi:FtsH-binding integral membrane protein
VERAILPAAAFQAAMSESPHHRESRLKGRLRVGLAAPRRIAIAGMALALLGAAAVLWFAALFVGGDSRVLSSEWLGLMALLAGLGASVLFGHSRGKIKRSTTIAVLAALALWTTITVTAR